MGKRVVHVGTSVSLHLETRLLWRMTLSSPFSSHTAQSQSNFGNSTTQGCGMQRSMQIPSHYSWHHHHYANSSSGCKMEPFYRLMWSRNVQAPSSALISLHHSSGRTPRLLSHFRKVINLVCERHLIAKGQLLAGGVDTEQCSGQIICEHESE